MSGARAGRAAKSRAGYPWWIEPAAWLGAMLVRLFGLTWRIERVNMNQIDAQLMAGERCIYALWHSRLFPTLFTHRGQGVAVLVSRHRDGQLVTRIIERLGFVTGRGSSTRGGEEGLRDMMEWAERGHRLAITPDGPRGPAERVKPGLLFLASHTGYPILPVAAASRSIWQLRSWDRFQIPRPFARVVVGYGAPIVIPAGLERDRLDALQGEVEAAIVALTADLERRAGQVA